MVCVMCQADAAHLLASYPALHAHEVQPVRQAVPAQACVPLPDQQLHCRAQVSLLGAQTAACRLQLGKVKRLLSAWSNVLHKSQMCKRASEQASQHLVEALVPQEASWEE